VPNRLSAIDSISPAFTRTKQMLFRPFRFGMWARLAVVSVVTGEFATGGGSVNINTGSHGSKWSAAARLLSEPGWERTHPYLALISMGAIVLVVALFLLWAYCDSVYRFILLDAVLSGQYRLR